MSGRGGTVDDGPRVLDVPVGVEVSGAGAAGSEPDALGLGYRPYLDGLRAVAVYLVVLFHAGSDRFGGGFVGVDVFFVLSGFLVTRLLLRDLNGRGSIRFDRFYARRFRRLLPAAFVTLVVTALVFSAVASPVEVLDAVGGFKAAFLYVTNWYFIAQAADYFGADLSSNPVLHFWSLAVEEQFYLLWPLLLGGLYALARRFGSRSWLVVRVAVVAAAVASLAWAWSLRVTNPNRAYYGTDARAYQLLAGALLALTPTIITGLARRPRAARWTATAGLVGIIAVASTWTSLDPIQRGVAVTVITVTLIAALEATAGTGPAPRLLSLAPVVYLGQVSYGTYLWHWPVILILTRSFHPATLPTIAITVLVATALASLSYQLLEQPIRLSAVLDRHRRTVIAVGLATSITAALIIIPAITNPHTTTTAALDNTNLTTTGFTPVPTGINWQTIKNDFPQLHDCYGQPADACTLIHGTGPHLLLIGDSHAAMLIPTFTQLANQHHLTLSVSVRLACPWQQDLYAQPLAAANQRLDECRRVKDDLYNRVIPALHPDIIITMNQSDEDPAYAGHYLGPDQRPIEIGSAGFDSWLKQTTVDSVAKLRAQGSDVVLIEPMPRAPEGMDTLACLSHAAVVAQCRYTADTKPTSLERLYRQLDKQDDHVWSADLDKLVCPYLPICDPIINNQIVTTDGAHLTATFAVGLADPVAEFLRSNGIVPA